MTATAEAFQRELERHQIAWCRGGCGSRSSHKRGFATKDTVHYDTDIRTRSTLYGGLHEIAHVVLGRCGRNGSRSWQQEQEAEAWAQKRMRELGFAVPRKRAAAGKGYVARKRRWGTNISKAHRHRFVPYGQPEAVPGYEGIWQPIRCRCGQGGWDSILGA